MGSQRIAIVLCAVVALTVTGAGCSGSGNAARHGNDAARPTIVASTNVYGDIARHLVGRAGRVETIVSDLGVDPHDYVAGARDLLAVSRADAVVMNGGGYDAFMHALIDAEEVPRAKIVDAFDVAGRGTANEHVFFDPSVMARVTGQLSEILVTTDPANAAGYRANARAMDADFADLRTRQRAIAARHRGTPVLVTDPAPEVLTQACGLADRTPAGFAAGVEAGEGVPPRVLQATIAMVRSGRVDVVVTNPSSLDAQVARVLAAARAEDIPVVEISEILPTGRTYVGWMHANLDTLSTALDAHR